MALAADRATTRAQLAKTRAALAGAGISYAWLDAEILVAHVLRSSREGLHTHPEQRLTASQQQRLQRLTGRLANLPYISERQKRVRPKELAYEPALALDGGADGLGLIRTALAQAPAVVKPGGGVLFECDPAQTRRMVRLAQAHWPLAQVSVHK